MGIYLSLSFSKTFRIETINTLIPSLVPSKTIYPIPDQNGQSLYRPVFRPKRHKNPTLWGGTYLYGLYMGGPPEGYHLCWTSFAEVSLQCATLNE